MSEKKHSDIKVNSKYRILENYCKKNNNVIINFVKCIFYTKILRLLD